MAQVLSLSRNAVLQAPEIIRSAVVFACGLALVMAGAPLPF